MYSSFSFPPSTTVIFPLSSTVIGVVICIMLPCKSSVTCFVTIAVELSSILPFSPAPLCTFITEPLVACSSASSSVTAYLVSSII